MKAIIERTIYYDLVVFLFVALPYLAFDHHTLLELRNFSGNTDFFQLRICLMDLKGP